MGCPKPISAPEIEQPSLPDELLRRRPIDGPVRWDEPGGLCLDIPEGWSGTSGSPPVLLDLVQADSGFGLAIRTWSPGQTPPLLDGFYVVFEDEGIYRTVPLLPAAGTRTWASEDPDGPTVQTWYGQLGERIVEIAASCPIDRFTEGRAVIDALVREICFEP